MVIQADAIFQAIMGSRGLPAIHKAEIAQQSLFRGQDNTFLIQEQRSLGLEMCLSQVILVLLWWFSWGHLLEQIVYPFLFRDNTNHVERTELEYIIQQIMVSHGFKVVVFRRPLSLAFLCPLREWFNWQR
jgi:hypothetical protein